MIKSFDIAAVHRWLKRHCWHGGSPTGECRRSSAFIASIFGWKIQNCSYHTWNVTEDNRILDTTVQQFGFRHHAQLVPATTPFDRLRNEVVTYQYAILRFPYYSNVSHLCVRWLLLLQRQLNESRHDMFGLSRSILKNAVEQAIVLHGEV